MPRVLAAFAATGLGRKEPVMVTARPGRLRGRMIRVSTPHHEHPSIWAASSTSRGISMKKL
jgi:hypothetical protein